MLCPSVCVQPKWGPCHRISAGHPPDDLDGGPGPLGGEEPLEAAAGAEVRHQEKSVRGFHATSGDPRPERQDPDRVARDPNLPVQDPKRAAPGSNPAAQDPILRVQDPKRTARGSNPGAQDPNLRGQDPKRAAQGSNAAAQDPKRRVQGPKLTAQGSQPAAQGPILLVQDPKRATQGSTLDAQAQDPPSPDPDPAPCAPKHALGALKQLGQDAGHGRPGCTPSGGLAKARRRRFWYRLDFFPISVRRRRTFEKTTDGPMNTDKCASYPCSSVFICVHLWLRSNCERGLLKRRVPEGLLKPRARPAPHPFRSRIG